MTAQPHSPGPGRFTADAAFEQVKKEIARRNEHVQKAAREAQAARKRKQVELRRELDRL